MSRKATPTISDRLSRGLSRLAVLFLVLLPFGAAGHDLKVPKADHLRISPERIRLEIRYDLAAGLPSEELRALFDKDRNHRLDTTEREALTAYLELAATHFLRVRIDGAPLSFRVVERRVAPLDPPLPSPRSIQSTFALEASLPPWTSRRRLLVLEDRHKDKTYPLSVSIAPEGGLRLSEGWAVAGEQRSALPPLRPGSSVLTGVLLQSGERLELRLERAGQGSR